MWDVDKEILGFDFNGVDKTMILGEGRLQFLLTTNCQQQQGWNTVYRI
jgi:hypothetical protein